jgi:hypothetical protein
VVDFSGNGMIAWAPTELIEGVFNHSVNAGSRQRIALLARFARAESENLDFICEHRESLP